MRVFHLTRFGVTAHCGLTHLRDETDLDLPAGKRVADGVLVVAELHVHATQWALHALLVYAQGAHPVAFRFVPLEIVALTGLPAPELFEADAEAARAFQIGYEVGAAGERVGEPV